MVVTNPRGGADVHEAESLSSLRRPMDMAMLGQQWSAEGSSVAVAKSRSGLTAFYARTPGAATD